MIRGLRQINIFIKLLVAFFLYILFLYVNHYQGLNALFFVSTIAFFLATLFFVYQEKYKFNLLYKSFDDLFYKATKEGKSHKSLESIIESLNYIKKDIIEKKSSILDLEQSRSKFLGNVSHELKTPLFVIQGYLDTLLDESQVEEKTRTQFLKKIKKQADRLDLLLSDLMKISMIESDELKLDIELVELDEIVSDIKSMFDNKLRQRGSKLIVPDNTNIRVKVDRSQMMTVLSNLIANGINYSTDGDVILSIKKDFDRANIKVMDQGIGIKQEHLSKIFERFYRVDSDRSRNKGGTGLGLAIVKHILLAHGTQIYAYSREGVGSEFAFSIPIEEN